MPPVTTKQLLEDIDNRRRRNTSSSNRAASKIAPPIAEVFRAVDRYAMDCLEARRGIVLPGFCKIGWQVVSFRGKSVTRPSFVLLDTFCRGFNVRMSPESMSEGGPTSNCEPFNFSKAAIRYSKSLTKDSIFSGYRALVQQIGEVIGQSRQLMLEFSFGRLSAQERVVHFHFGPHMRSPEEAGDSSIFEGSRKAQAAADHVLRRLTENPPSMAAAAADVEGASRGIASRSCSRRSARGCDSALASPPTTGGARSPLWPDLEKLPAVRSKLQEHAYADALHRQIDALEVRASEAFRSKAEGECAAYCETTMQKLKEEQQEARMREHVEVLQRQMQDREVQKKSERVDLYSAQAAASAPQDADARRFHAAALKRDMLPSHEKEARAEKFGALGGTAVVSRVRRDLEEQITEKQRRREELKRQEQASELGGAFWPNAAMDRMRNEQVARVREQQVCEAAWREEAQLREIKRRLDAMERGYRPSRPLQTYTPGGSQSARGSTPEADAGLALSARGSALAAKMVAGGAGGAGSPLAVGASSLMCGGGRCHAPANTPSERLPPWADAGAADARASHRVSFAGAPLEVLGMT